VSYGRAGLSEDNTVLEIDALSGDEVACYVAGGIGMLGLAGIIYLSWLATGNGRDGIRGVLGNRFMYALTCGLSNSRSI